MDKRRARIFLVGVPRSGTTLLQSLVAAHPMVTSFTESHLFSRPFRQVPGVGLVLTSDPTPRLREFLAENGASAAEVAPWFGPPTPEAVSTRLRRAASTRAVARRLVDVLDALGQARGLPVWLEKTPRHLQAIDLLESVCDDGVPTRFVHVFRAGLQTIASLYEASASWPEPYDLDTCIERWNNDLKRSARCIDRPGHCFVRYETLTRDPEPVLRALFAELDLAWEPDVLSRFETVSNDLRTPGEAWKVGVGRPIEPSSRAGDVLDEAQRTRVQNRLDVAAHETLRRRALAEHGHD